MSAVFARPLLRTGRPCYYVWRINPTQLAACTRHLQTFNKREEGTRFGNYVSKKLHSKTTQLVVYFTLATGIMFFVCKLAWDHQESTQPATASVMTMDQLEMLTRMGGGKKHSDRTKPVDAKGLEEMMEDLYKEHMSGQGPGYENIRGPRPEEPETLIMNEAVRIAKLTERSKDSFVAFTQADYSKIKPHDIVLDIGEEE